MHHSKKRRLSILVTGVAVAAIAGVAAFGAAIGDGERIGSMWISARLQPEGLAVTEVIDYDIGPQQRHDLRCRRIHLRGVPCTARRAS